MKMVIIKCTQKLIAEFLGVPDHYILDVKKEFDTQNILFVVGGEEGLETAEGAYICLGDAKEK